MGGQVEFIAAKHEAVGFRLQGRLRGLVKLRVAVVRAWVEGSDWGGGGITFEGWFEWFGDED